MLDHVYTVLLYVCVCMSVCVCGWVGGCVWVCVCMHTCLLKKLCCEKCLQTKGHNEFFLCLQVLWQIFAEPFGTSLPQVYDLLFIGQKPTTMSSVPSKRREGTGTDVFSFSGAVGKHFGTSTDVFSFSRAVGKHFSHTHDRC